MLQKFYAKALLDLFKERKDEKIFSNFLKLIKARGHDALLPGIKRELEKILAEEKKKEKVTLYVGDKVSTEEEEKVLKMFEEKFGKISEVEKCKDENLIGGVKVVGRGARIDWSYKRRLELLYSAMIKGF